jgi:hypothetical protein
VIELVNNGEKDNSFTTADYPLLKFSDFGLAVLEKHDETMRGSSLWTVFVIK